MALPDALVSLETPDPITVALKEDNEEKDIKKIDLENPGGPNVVRTFAQYIYPKLKNSLIGYYYLTLHNLLLLGGGLILLFSDNVVFLTMLCLIIMGDAACIVTLHNCPLTLLEQNYLDRNFAKETKNAFAYANIVYNCEHVYETQLEFVINLWTFVVFKIFALMLLRTFHVTWSK
jgi:hypothetical protein